MGYLLHRLQVSFSTHQLRTFFVIMFLFTVSEGILIFQMPLLADNVVGGFAVVGVLLGVANIAGFITDLIFGFVTEISDHRKFMHTASVLSFLILPLLFFSQNFWVLVLLAIVWGVRFELMVCFGSNIFLAKHSPPGKFLTTSGMSYLVKNLGFFIGPILANLFWVNWAGGVVVILATIFVLEALLMYLTFNDHPAHTVQHKVRHLSLYAEYKVLKLHFKEVFPHFLLSFGIGVFEAVFMIFGPVAFSKFNPQLAGVLTSVGLLANVLFPALIIRAVKRFGAKSMLTLAAIGITAVSLILWSTNRVELLLVGIFVSFIFLAIIFVVNDSTFLEKLSRLKTSEEDEIVSIRGMGTNLAYISVALLGGVVISQFGFGVGILTAVAILLSSVLLFKLTQLNDPLRAKPEMYG